MHKPKLLKDLEKLALHFVLDECVMLLPKVKPPPHAEKLRKDPTHYKRTASTTPLQSPSFSSQFPLFPFQTTGKPD